MARILEQEITIKFSTVVPSTSTQEYALTAEELEMLVSSLPDLAKSIVETPGIVIEIE